MRQAPTFVRHPQPLGILAVESGVLLEAVLVAVCATAKGVVVIEQRSRTITVKPAALWIVVSTGVCVYSSRHRPNSKEAKLAVYLIWV
jgi:hypothetical protein